MSKLKDFRPISLSNVSYKRITKILSHKLRSLMEKLVNPCQCSFPPNRQSRDNIIIAQEVFHSMRNKKGATGWMEIKIDLEKAYECLNWNFITDTLSNIGCPGNFIGIIWNCIHPLKGKCFGMIRLLKNLSLWEEWGKEIQSIHTYKSLALKGFCILSIVWLSMNIGSPFK